MRLGLGLPGEPSSPLHVHAGEQEGPEAKKTIRVRMAGRPEPVVAWNTPNTNRPIVPPNRSKMPKNPNISPAL